ncbi:MAG: ABC transporter substrate-binding protein [Oscillospiraceae bacterium]|nr:ABC transporter substrate-binding protein [Oscillospiraceae bacterium]
MIGERSAVNLKRIKISVVLLICSLMILTMPLTACSEEEDGADHDFYVTVSENPQNLDPQIAEDLSSIFVIRNIYSSLMELDSNGLAVCSAAQSYRVSDDGLTYEFTLRDGLCWYTDDGEIPLTADDYVYAFRRIYDSTTGSPHTEIFSCIKNSLKVLNGELPSEKLGVYAADEQTVVFELENTNCDFLKLMTHWGSMPCCEELFLKTNGRYGLSAENTYSCGAFRLTVWNYDPYWNDNYLTLERIPSNSVEDFRTYPSSVTIGITDDPEGYESKNGVEIDAYTAASLDSIEKKELNKASVNEYTAETICLIASSNSALFSDENGMKAVASALNRDISQELAGNLISAGSIIPPYATIMNTAFRNLSPDVRVSFERSPEKYWENYMENNPSTDLYGFTLLASDDVADSGIALYAAQQLNEVLGIYCTVESKTENDYQSALGGDEYDFVIASIKPQINLTEEYFGEINDIIGWNEIYPETAELLLSAESAANISDKKDIIRAAETEYILDGYAVPLCYGSEYLIQREGREDIYYDPFTESMYFKYAKYF